MLSFGSGQASALPLTTYAENSKLAEGKWVKISVDRTGAHLLTDAALRQMGFTDPSRVRIYGYGATRQPEIINDSFVDDLPMVQTMRTDRGIIFYAVGPLSWTYTDRTWRPVNNPFTLKGYYFLSESDEAEPEIPTEGLEGTLSTPSTITGLSLHELESFNPGHTGHTLLGEDFRYTSSRTFKLDMPDRKPGGSVLMVTSFMAKSTELSQLSISVNGTPISSTGDRINAISDGHIHYNESLTTKYIFLDNNETSLTVDIGYSSRGNITTAALNYISVNYDRILRPSDSGLWFTSNTTNMAMEGGSTSLAIWDVTNPASLVSMKTAVNGGNLCWRNVYTGTRHYFTFNPEGSLPAPKYEGSVSNQNLHATEVPDMIIFTVPEWNQQAERLADLHRDRDGMKVTVINQQPVFNEFSSGAPDVQSFRKMLKMLYDRGQAQGKKLSYVLFFGRGTYDNRAICTEIKNLNYPLMPLWQSNSGNSDNTSYTTDDIFGFLADGSGLNLGSDKMLVSVGRMPITSSGDARNSIDKIEAYLSSAPGQWRNRALLIADDQDFATHMEQTDMMFSQMMANQGEDLSYRKLYTDEYTLSNGTYPEARTQMFRAMEEGVVWLTYIGHANTTSWTHEGLLTFTDINNLHLKYLPAVYAATCEFQRVDDNDISAGEIMWKLTTGGCIAIISANRPVYIDQNGTLSESMGRNMFRLDSYGNRLRIGDIIRNAKNNYGNPTNDGTLVYSNENKLRFSLIGDPALRLVLPSSRVIVDRINGQDINGEEPPVIKAFQNATIEGHVENSDGTPLTDFNGLLTTTIFDAEHSVTTKGNGEKGKEYVFEQQGDRVYTGNDSIRAGKFCITIPMPAEISNNWRPAAAQFFAKSLVAEAQPEDHAAGMNRDFYLFGYDETTAPDNTPPTIKAIYINHPSFRDGDVVNLTPMLVAELTDNRGINVATSGIGRLMTVTLDNRLTYADVCESFVPSPTDNGGGTVHYQLPELSQGNHTLNFRVWDTASNYATADLNFYARSEVKPKLYDVYTDTNTASVEANFYLSHDRPDATINVALTIYNLLGQPVRTIESSAGSDLYLTNPIKWDLTDDAGRRVTRGIYIYRAHISEGSLESDTMSRKIAVTAE